MSINSIEKEMPGKGDLSEKEQLMKLADAEKIEFDVMQNLLDTIQEDFEKERQPGESYIDWLKGKDAQYFKQIKLSGGGKVISITDYLKSKEKPKIKEIDLASMFTPNKTLSSLTDAEREAVNNLLKLTLGK